VTAEPLSPRRADRTVVEAVAASMQELPGRYLPDRAANSPRRYIVRVTGCPPYTITSDGPRCEVRQVVTGDAHAELHTDPASWLDIVSGHRDGLDCFFLGLLEVFGDLNEALRLETLFAPPQDSPGALRHARLVRYPFGRGAIETFEAGDPSAPPVLFLHGLGASKVSLLPAIAGLAETHRVIAMDFPGFGKSSAPVGARYDAPWMASAALATLDAADVSRAAIVGNSMGGRVAVELALLHPERVSALGLLCPAVAFDEYRLVRPLLNFMRMDTMGVAPWPLSSAWPRRFIDTGLRSMFADPSRVPAANLVAAREDFIRVMASRNRRMAFLASTRRLGLEAPAKFWHRLGDLDVPSLWIFARHDRLVSCTYAENVRRHLPAATVEVWEDCGHVPQFEHPVTTVERLRDFFDAAAGS
jgi:pimeloyl-ACP methyl ester carboxylesterase